MIKLISAYTSNLSDLAKISLPSFKKYCEIFGYDYEFYEIPSTYNKPASWFKIDILIQQFQHSQYRYILWIDIDAIILNKNFILESILEEDKFLYLARDFNNINCGVLLSSNNEYMNQFFQHISLQTQYINHTWWEQAAIIDMFENNYSDIQNHIKFIPQDIWNAYDYKLYGYQEHEGNVHNSSFIFHVPGLEHHIKLYELERYNEFRTY